MGQPRIDIFISNLQGGGAERVCVTQANVFAARGYDVRLVVFDLHHSAYDHLLDPAVRLIDLGKPFSRSAYGLLAAYLYESQPHCCLSHTLRITLALAVLRQAYQLPMTIISVIHNDPDKTSESYARTFYGRRLAPLVQRLIHPHVDHIVTVSNGLQQCMIAKHNVCSSRISTIYNPIDPQILAPLPAPPRTRNHIYAIGRLAPQKGFDRLLEAVSLSIPHRPDLHLHLCGDGPQRVALTQQAQQLGIAHAVTFHGFVDNIASIYRQAHVVILSSHYEAMPMVVIEAIACGTPVVAFDCDFGPREVITDGLNGFLVPQDDVPALAQTILRALDYAWDAAQIAASVQHFGQEVIMDQYIALMNRLGCDTAARDR